uniref:ceramide kinase-like isoform X2 n=1 Tax=Erigeron canadensis TaxID=72917 RepID=UPI001CB94AED|nr:ceramide kinase-like isoform X2 [Erigeron canadensis]
MERDTDFIRGDDDGGGGEKKSILTSSFFMGQVGEVNLGLKSDGLYWELIESFSDVNEESTSCFGIWSASKTDTYIRISDVYDIEFIDWGLVHETRKANPGCLVGHLTEMYRFRVHGVQRSKAQPCLWTPVAYTFGHDDKQTCQLWVNQLKTCLGMEIDRPKSLLVFVNPRSGKRNGRRIWENVYPLFSQAKVKTKVIVTERAGHACDAMTSITSRELNSYDGVVAVGGDGLFNEILNGLLLSRHKAPYPPMPPDNGQTVNIHNDIEELGPIVTMAEPLVSGEDESPLLSSSLDDTEVANPNHDSEISFPNERFRFGLIPSGSTDAIVICTTGARDPVTSALQIILGERLRLDIAQVVRWKTLRTSKLEPLVRYTASFAGYGFYGDVITESEKYRWMGPKRYDYAGTKVFLKHRSYEAEVTYMEVEPEKTNIGANGRRIKAFWGLSKDPERVPCRAKCSICNSNITSDAQQESKLVRVKGRFLSIGAAVISCRNEKAPDGLVADAHLSDGFLHLILIKDCPRAFYLWHLTQLARKGGTPLNFDFVEHHKTTAFTFTSFGEESVWNVDGEVLVAHKLSAQVFRGLINLFASGPET